MKRYQYCYYHTFIIRHAPRHSLDWDYISLLIPRTLLLGGGGEAFEMHSDDLLVSAGGIIMGTDASVSTCIFM